MAVPFLPLLFALALWTCAAVAQPDSVAVPVVLVDTTEAATPGPSYPSPGTALRRSLLVPGWGQLTNRDYLKIPVVVAGVGGFAALVVLYNNRTVRYRRAAIYADGEVVMLDATPDPTNPNPDFVDEWLAAGGFPAATNRALRDLNRRNRDFSILIGSLAYALQALDAYVSAELADFDVSEDLSLHLVPTPTGATASLRWQF